MKTMMKFLVVGVTMLAACSSCGGNWVDLALVGSCKELDAIMKKKGMEKENFTFVARQMCASSGKAWTGDTRCENDAPQIKCK